ncbi:MAG: NAD(P)-dependent oxidoreductase, partial [Bacteroidia bacterium]|nr:NAD(P)-dependent oxidoreductase [Bacteroidia bacterium]
FFRNETKKFDVVFHLASKMADSNNLNDLNLLQINPTMAKHVAIAIKENKIKYLINLSSSSVYPNTDGTFDEQQPTDSSQNSDCIYGLSKFNSEVLFNYFLKNTDTTINHLRCSMIYGEGMNEAHLFPVLEKELRENDTVTLFGNGERNLNIIHVDRLINYLNLFLEYPQQGIINVSDECITLYQLGCRIVGSGNEQKIILKPQGNKNKFVLDIKKLRNILATQPGHD